MTHAGGVAERDLEGAEFEEFVADVEDFVEVDVSFVGASKDGGDVGADLDAFLFGERDGVAHGYEAIGDGAVDVALVVGFA